MYTRLNSFSTRKSKTQYSCRYKGRDQRHLIERWYNTIITRIIYHYKIKPLSNGISPFFHLTIIPPIRDGHRRHVTPLATLRAPLTARAALLRALYAKECGGWIYYIRDLYIITYYFTGNTCAGWLKGVTWLGGGGGFAATGGTWYCVNWYNVCHSCIISPHPFILCNIIRNTWCCSAVARRCSNCRM